MTTKRRPRNALETIELFCREDGGFHKPLMPRRWLSTIRVKDGTKMHYNGVQYYQDALREFGE
jgi:hypothetical protein